MIGWFEIYTNGEKQCMLNTILDIGIGSFAFVEDVRARCVIGDDMTPNDSSLTGVVSPLLSANRSSEFFYRVNSDDRYTVNHAMVYTFTVPEDIVIHEIGVCNTAELTFFSRARAVDNNGNPAKIKINAGEELKIVHTVEITPATIDDVTTFDIDGTEYTMTIRPADIDDQTIWRNINSPVNMKEIQLWENFDLSDPTLGGIKSGDTIQFTPLTVEYMNTSFVANGFTFEINPYGFPNTGFVSGVGGVYVRFFLDFDAAYQIKFDPPIPTNYFANSRSLKVFVDLRS